MAELHTEQQLRGEPQCEREHVVGEVGRLAGVCERFPAGGEQRQRSGHGRTECTRAERAEERLNQPALAAPAFTLERQQPIGHGGPEHLVR